MHDPLAALKALQGSPNQPLGPKSPTVSTPLPGSQPGTPPVLEDLPIQTRECRRNSRKTTWFPSLGKMRPLPATASQGSSYRIWNSSTGILSLPGDSVRSSTHDKGHEEGGSAYAKAGSSLRSPPGIVRKDPRVPHTARRGA